MKNLKKKKASSSDAFIDYLLDGLKDCHKTGFKPVSELKPRLNLAYFPHTSVDQDQPKPGLMLMPPDCHSKLFPL